MIQSEFFLNKDGEVILEIEKYKNKYFSSKSKFKKIYVDYKNQHRVNRLIDAFSLLLTNQKKVLVYILENINRFNIVKFKKTELSKIIKLDEKNIYFAIKKLIDNDIIRRLEHKNIYILNPNIVFNGSMINRIKCSKLFYNDSYSYKNIRPRTIINEVAINDIYDTDFNVIGHEIEKSFCLYKDTDFDILYLNDLSIFEELTTSEFIVFKYLVNKRYLKDNYCILYDKQLSQELKVSNYIIKNTIKKLEDKNIMKGTNSKNVYFINPDFIYCGTEKNRNDCLYKYKILDLKLKKDITYNMHLN